MNILMIGFEDLRWGTVRLAKPLREAGLQVAALCPLQNPLAHTRFIDRVFPLNDVRSMRFVEAALADAIRQWRPVFIIPADEQVVACLHALVRHPARDGARRLNAAARALIIASLGDPAQFDAMLMKSETLRLARHHGVRVPAGESVSSATQAEAAAVRVGFPAFVKSSFSWGGRGVTLCHDGAEVAEAMAATARPRRLDKLRDRVRHLLHRDWYPTETAIDVQQAILGEPAMYCCVALAGKTLAGFAGFALTTSTPNGPSTIVRLGAHEAMAQAAETMIAASKASGFIGFDFMIEAATGLPYLIECNPRPIQVCHLGPRIGIDLCAALAAGLAGGPMTIAKNAGAQDVIALFPQEWLRDPAGLSQLAHPVDVPWDDRPLLTLMTSQRSGGWNGHVPLSAVQSTAPDPRGDFAGAPRMRAASRPSASPATFA